MSEVKNIAEAVGFDMHLTGQNIAVVLIEKDNRHGSFERMDLKGAEKFGFIVASSDLADKQEWNGAGESIVGCKVLIPKMGGHVYRGFAIVDVRDVRMYKPAKDSKTELTEFLKKRNANT